MSTEYQDKKARFLMHIETAVDAFNSGNYYQAAYHAGMGNMLYCDICSMGPAAVAAVHCIGSETSTAVDYMQAIKAFLKIGTF